MEASSKSAWEMILKSCKRDDTGRDCEGGEEQQVEPATAAEEEDEASTPALGYLTADEVSQPLKNALAPIPELVEGAVDALV